MIPQPTYGQNRRRQQPEMVPPEETQARLEAEQQPQQAAQQAPQPQQQPQQQQPLVAVPNNISQFPRPRLTFGPLGKWMIAVAVTLAATAIISFLLSEVDGWEAPPSRPRRPTRSPRPSTRRYAAVLDEDDEDDGDESDEEDEQPPARRRSNRGRGSRRPATSGGSQPIFNVHLPNGQTHQTPAAPPSGTGG